MRDARTAIDYVSLAGRTNIFILLACAAVLLAATQGVVQELLSGGMPRPGAILEWRVTPVLIWVLAAPFLLDAPRAVGRTTKGSKAAALVAHVSLAAAWIVVSNLLMRVPAAIRGEPLGALLVDAVRGAVEYGPAAAAAYVCLLAIALPRRGDPAEGEVVSLSDEFTASRRSPNGLNHLAVRNGVRIHLIERTVIRWVEADGDHVIVHTPEKSYRTRATLTAFEHELEADGFLRIHRSALVNPRAIREIQTLYRGDHVAVLHDGTEIRIPRTREYVIESLLSPIGED